MNYCIEVTDGIGEVLQVWECVDFSQTAGTLLVQFEETNLILYRLPEGSVTRITEVVQGGFDQ